MVSSKVKLEHYADALKGISYSDWVRLKSSVDLAFAKQRKEAELGLYLSSGDEVKKIIHSQFG